MAKTRDFAQVIRRRLAHAPRLRSAVERELLYSTIGGLIYDARVEAGLTQAQLAERVGTHQSVIARLEDADYGGHSLNMLERIAAALGRELRISMGPKRRRKSKR